jgi:uncharacterized membrane protein
VSKARLEAFSDGVIAVAITLLVLNLPSSTSLLHSHASLAHSLGEDWTQFVAYAISFVTIGIIWINHHAALARLREVDDGVLIVNLLVLMTIVVIPFATDLMASYLRARSGEKLAAAIYGGTFLLMAAAFTALNRQTLISKPHLMHGDTPEQLRRATLRRATVGVVPYAVATALAAVSPYLTLAIAGALALFYALPVSRAVPSPR